MSNPTLSPWVYEGDHIYARFWDFGDGTRSNAVYLDAKTFTGWTAALYQRGVMDRIEFMRGTDLVDIKVACSRRIS